MFIKDIVFRANRRRSIRKSKRRCCRGVIRYDNNNNNDLINYHVVLTVVWPATDDHKFYMIIAFQTQNVIWSATSSNVVFLFCVFRLFGNLRLFNIYTSFF